MIDYDATLVAFFSEMIKYLSGRAYKITNAKLSQKIRNAIYMVGVIAENPAEYASYDSRVKLGAEDMDFADAFIAERSRDNSVYLMYMNVVNSMGNLNSPYEYYRDVARENLVKALKAIKYKNSTSLVKGLTYPFFSPMRFAVKQQIQR